MAQKQLETQHLLWRAGFGPRVDDTASIKNTSRHQTLASLIKATSRVPEKLAVTTGTLRDFYQRRSAGKAMANDTPNPRRELRRESADGLRRLNILWLSHMIRGDDQLREKMSLFWHGHFACRNVNIYYQQDLLDIIRQNALGHFGDLLRSVSKTPAMLSFLNNQQNRKQHPNENFAREVMELFTLGRGNYTEEDVKESARAYTGWGFNALGEFQDRTRFHDDGIKIFLGKKGNFSGDDALNIILEQQATARFLARKIYAFFVNEEVDEDRVQQLAEGFYQSNYNILQLMMKIFSSDWFYQRENIGIRIKSPVELIACIQRILPMELDKPQMQLVLQRALGQVLFYPPNVAGWPGGRSWIDSSSLMLRLRLPQMLAMADPFVLQEKRDDDEMMGMETSDQPYKRKIASNVEWAKVAGAYDAAKREDLAAAITSRLLQTKSRVPANILHRYASTASRDAFIKSVTIQTMSTPEYQLC